jgi:DNA polymerase-4
MSYRKIIHIDMDAFYASVEQREQPELRGKPVAVGGGGRRGVVAAASYEARKYGVRSAMPGFKARDLCPGLIFVKPRFELYHSVSQEIRTIFHEYTDLVEPLSLDEAYLDVTENKRGLNSGTLLAKEIRKRILDTTRLTASAGISFNKFLAKVASDINKPNGQKVITPEEAIPFLESLAVGKFHGIGKVTARKMHQMGVTTGADLKKWSRMQLVQRFGKAGNHYYEIVRAQDDRPVRPNRIRKSVGAERTFGENLERQEELQDKLLPLVERVYKTMKKKENFGRTITLKMKSTDFQIATRSKSFPREITSLDELKQVALELLSRHYHELGALRLIGFSVSNLRHDRGGEGIQLELDLY